MNRHTSWDRHTVTGRYTMTKYANLWIIVTLLAGASRADAKVARVEVSRDAVVIEGEGLSAQDAIAALSEAAGVELHGTANRERIRTLAIRAANLDQALRRLLGGQSFAVRYGVDGAPRRIDLLDAGVGEASASSTTAAPQGLRPGAGPAQALGTEQPRLDELLRAVVAQPDTAVRAHALQAIAGALENEPAFAATVLDVLQALDDDALAQQLEAIAGDDALRVSRAIAQATTLPALRERLLAAEPRLATRTQDAAPTGSSCRDGDVAHDRTDESR